MNPHLAFVDTFNVDKGVAIEDVRVPGPVVDEDVLVLDV